MVLFEQEAAALRITKYSRKGVQGLSPGVNVTKANVQAAHHTDKANQVGDCKLCRRRECRTFSEIWHICVVRASSRRADL